MVLGAPALAADGVVVAGCEHQARIVTVLDQGVAAAVAKEARGVGRFVDNGGVLGGLHVCDADLCRRAHSGAQDRKRPVGADVAGRAAGNLAVRDRAALRVAADLHVARKIGQAASVQAAAGGVAARHVVAADLAAGHRQGGVIGRGRVAGRVGVDAATLVCGGVAGDGAAAHGEGPGVPHAAALGAGGVAGDGAAIHGEGAQIIEAATLALVGRGVAGDGAAPKREGAAVTHAASRLALLVRDLARRLLAIGDGQVRAGLDGDGVLAGRPGDDAAVEAKLDVDASLDFPRVGKRHVTRQIIGAGRRG